MTTAPWLIIPVFLVPSLLFIHIVIFARVLKTEVRTPAASWRVPDGARPISPARYSPTLRLHRAVKRGEVLASVIDSTDLAQARVVKADGRFPHRRAGVDVMGSLRIANPATAR